MRSKSSKLGWLASLAAMASGLIVTGAPAQANQIQASRLAVQGLSHFGSDPAIIGARSGGVVWVEESQVFADAEKYVDLVVYNQGLGADSYSIERLIDGQWQADSLFVRSPSPTPAIRSGWESADFSNDS